MPSTQTPIHITHIGTATALIELEGLTILTDPYFSPAGTVWTGASGAKLISSYQPALGLEDLPPIDLILLSHEDHKDNLDDLGRQLLNGRRVITTKAGATKLQPRSAVRGLDAWESTSVQLAGGQSYQITATPCVHLPGGQCIGFLITADHFGETNGKPNAIYLSGDTIYIPELAQIKDTHHVSVALFNMGKATVPNPKGGEPLQITMDVEQALLLAKDTEPEVVIPMHFEGWNHFKEGEVYLRTALKDSRFRILQPGKREQL